MASVQHLLETVCRRRKTTVVWGDLGRQPSLLAYYLDLCFEAPTVVRVSSDLWDQTGMDETFEDDGTRCDVLVWLEPNFGETVTRPPYAERMIVLSSHLNLLLPKRDCLVVVHHVGDASRQPREFRGYVDGAAEDGATVLRPGPFLRSDGGGRQEETTPLPDSVFAVDIAARTNAREAYLCLLNARLALGLHGDLVKEWRVAMCPRVQASLELNLRECARRSREYVSVDGVMDDVYLSHDRHFHCTKMDALETAILREVEREFRCAPGYRTKHALHLEVLKRVANVLDLPVAHCTPDTCRHASCMVLSERDVRELDETWYRLAYSEDCGVSVQERRHRERFEQSGSHVETNDMTNYASVLFKKSSIAGRGFNRRERILKDGRLNRLFAVDGFCGFLPSDFKHYVTHLDSSRPRRSPYEAHLAGVRAMYGSVGDELNGTDAACVVFLALCRRYGKPPRQLDDRMRMMLGKSERVALGFLEKSANYYTELGAILRRRDEFLEGLGDVYGACFGDQTADGTDQIAADKILQLCANERNSSLKKLLKTT